MSPSIESLISRDTLSSHWLSLNTDAHKKTCTGSEHGLWEVGGGGQSRPGHLALELKSIKLI